jgi:hypothetical protein
MTPLEMDSRKGVGEEGFEWGPDTVEAEIRERVRGMIEVIVEEELESRLGACRSQRVGAVRTGYRNGARERELSTSLGKTTIRLPRARLQGADGKDSEWHSRIIPRYQRRTDSCPHRRLLSVASQRARSPHLLWHNILGQKKTGPHATSQNHDPAPRSINDRLVAASAAGRVAADAGATRLRRAETG